VRELRDLMRYRKTIVQERADEVNRLQKVLETANIKLAAVATDVLGKSGRSMLDAMLGGQEDPEALAELARGRMPRQVAGAAQSPGRTGASPSSGAAHPHTRPYRFSGRILGSVTEGDGAVPGPF
jgi:hypothetical protein